MEEPPAEGEELAIGFEVVAVCLIVVIVIMVF